MILLNLFLSFLQIGLLGIGGGLAAMPLISHQVVNVHGWLTYAEFTDLISIAETTPGPIAVNAATFVGTRLAGPLGAVVATFAAILPGCFIALAIARLCASRAQAAALGGALSGLRPAIIGLIAAGGLTFARAAVTDLYSGLAFVLCLLANARLRVNPVLLILLSGAARLLF